MTNNKPNVKIVLSSNELDIYMSSVFNILIGNAYGHPRVPNGTCIHTSAVVNRDGYTVETLNTRYTIISEPPTTQE